MEGEKLVTIIKCTVQGYLAKLTSHSSGQETNSLYATHHESSPPIPILRQFNSISTFTFLLLLDSFFHLCVGFPKQSPPLRSANPSLLNILDSIVEIAVAGKYQLRSTFSCNFLLHPVTACPQRDTRFTFSPASHSGGRIQSRPD
jgi:hypothetical protein